MPDNDLSQPSVQQAVIERLCGALGFAVLLRHKKAAAVIEDTIFEICELYPTTAKRIGITGPTVKTRRART